MKSETVYFQITLAAPLHIGCGEDYVPMGFVIDGEKKELVSFNPADFLAELSSEELKDYSRICRQGTVESIQDLYKFMRRYSGLARGIRIGVSSGFYKHYESVLAKSREEFSKEFNNFKINRTFFNPINNEPILPGSSIKGAVRTAVLNHRNNGSTYPPYKGQQASSNLQKDLLGGTFGKDPFSLIKISDFIPAGKVSRKINYSVSFSKKDGERKVSQMQEVIEAGSSFWGSITILSERNGIRNPVTPVEIITALQNFYSYEKNREDSELQKIDVQSTPLSKQGVPLRLGKHSGAECVTVNGHRHIKISPPGKPSKASKCGATTVWLAADSSVPKNMAGLQPMGWVQLAPLSDTELGKLKQQRQQYEAEQKQIREQELIDRLREREVAHQESARREKEVQTWQAMSEEEQEIAIIRGDALAKKNAPNKDILRDIWPKFDQADEDHQKDLAQAFMALWKEEGKWKVNKKKKKQFDKVTRVRSVLGIK